MASANVTTSEAVREFFGIRTAARGVDHVLQSPSLRYIGKRVVAAVPVIWGVTFLTFMIMNLLPGDAAQALLGAEGTPAEVHALEVKLHLNEPFFERYWHWLTSAVTGNLGVSLSSGQPVSSILAQRLPITFELVAFAFVISLVVSVPVAILAARRPGGIFDRVSMMISMVLLSVAPFVLGLALILYFGVNLRVLPTLGFSPVSAGLGSNLRSLLLPAISIAAPLCGGYSRLLRGDLVEQVMSADYVLTAASKGASPWRILISHALRNGLFGLVTLVGLNLGTLIGSTVIIEQVFALPGIGSELLNAINSQDVPVVEGIVLVFAVCVVAANLLADLLYGVLDPRVRHGRAFR